MDQSPSLAANTSRAIHEMDRILNGCEAAGFRRGWTELFRLLGGYAAWVGLKPTFRDYQRPRTSGQACLTLEDGTGSLVTSIWNQLTPHNYPEDGKFPFLEGSLPCPQQPSTCFSSQTNPAPPILFLYDQF
jgi:hypothetical protein